VATDGRNWINFRRSQIGIATLAQNGQIDRAAQAHSDYQKLNNIVSHEEVSGKPGFTGVGVQARLAAAGYTFSSGSSIAWGEVIAASTNGSGFGMAEELITAIFHRFAIFEPQFKEVGTGSAITSAGYTYFTSDFAANNGYGPGIGRGALVTWPYNGQTQVTRNFFTDSEAPDPIPDMSVNEVGYPISVHGDISAVLTVQSFTIQPRGGAPLDVRLLEHKQLPPEQETEQNRTTPTSAAAIVPLAPLKAGTTYDVTFVGTADAIPVTKSWSFTTN
jgi:hypothetical protein